MHQRTGVRQTVREVRLVAPESMGALHRAPLAPPIADDDDQLRCRGPTGAAPLLLHCFVSGHLIRGMPQLEDALLCHPVDEIGIDHRVAAEVIILHLRIFKKIASESASRAVKRSQIDLASESLTAMTYWPLPSVAARLVGGRGD